MYHSLGGYANSTLCLTILIRDLVNICLCVWLCECIDPKTDVDCLYVLSRIYFLIVQVKTGDVVVVGVGVPEMVKVSNYLI